MFFLWKIAQVTVFSLHLFIIAVQGQGGGTLPNGDYYVCVPPGYCDNYIAPVPLVNPRIVTPLDECPRGQIPCITQGPTSQCGNRLGSVRVNNSDGPAPRAAYPWLAFVTNSTHPRYAGAGVLIDNYHILTAAHKVYGDRDRNRTGYVTVTMGVYNPYGRNEVNQTRRASRIIINPTYNRSGYFFDDIAVVRVSQPFNLSGNTINTACLPSARTSFERQRGCVVAGWGETVFEQHDYPTSPMKQVFLNVTSYATCRAAFANPSLLGSYVDRYLDGRGGELCAGGELMRDACTYDGGAPLICPGTAQHGTIAGLVIWGKNCGLLNVYGVYVNVSAYRQWIDQTLNSLNG